MSETSAGQFNPEYVNITPALRQSRANPEYYTYLDRADKVLYQGDIRDNGEFSVIAIDNKSRLRLAKHTANLDPHLSYEDRRVVLSEYLASISLDIKRQLPVDGQLELF